MNPFPFVFWSLFGGGSGGGGDPPPPGAIGDITVSVNVTHAGRVVFFSFFGDGTSENPLTLSTNSTGEPTRISLTHAGPAFYIRLNGSGTENDPYTL